MKELKDKCLEIRHEVLNIFEKGKRGHIPSAFSLVEILVSLFYFHSKITKKNYKDNDKILLSKGHGCLALYAILADLGFYDKSEYEKFCKVGGKLGGHPTRGKIEGIEISAGSLGHGPSIAIGKAIAHKLKGKKEKVFVIVGDGECNEGSVWEAALSANKNKLNNLTILIDYNKTQSYGSTQNVCPLEDFRSKWESFQFECFEADLVTEPESLLSILEIEQVRPRAIICHTIKGQGNSILTSDPSWHHRNKVSEQEMTMLRGAME